MVHTHTRASQEALVVKNPPANAGDLRDTGSIPRSGGSPGGGHGDPLEYSCLENPMDKGAWGTIVHRVAQSHTWVKRLSTHTHTHIYIHTYIFFCRIFFIAGYYKVLNIALCCTVNPCCYVIPRMSSWSTKPPLPIGLTRCLWSEYMVYSILKVLRHFLTVTEQGVSSANIWVKQCKKKCIHIDWEAACQVWD